MLDGAAPRVPGAGRVTGDLFGSDVPAGDLVCIHLEVPDGVGLRSSYETFNLLVDYCMVFGRRPECSADWESVFRPAAGDRVQVVVPWIARAWMKRVEELGK